jgi:hypothetical protein
MGAPTALSPFTFHLSRLMPYASFAPLCAICYWLLAIPRSGCPASMADHHPPNTHRHIGHGDGPMTS